MPVDDDDEPPEVPDPPWLPDAPVSPPPRVPSDAWPQRPVRPGTVARPLVAAGDPELAAWEGKSLFMSVPVPRRDLRTVLSSVTAIDFSRPFVVGVGYTRSSLRCSRRRGAS